MKQFSIILFALTSIVLAGCGNRIEKKIEKLINDEVKKSLYIPDSYDPVETIVDSAFSPYDNPSFLDGMMQAVALGNELERIDFQIKQAKSSMAIWGDHSYGYYSSYERNEYEDAKEKYEKALSQQSLMKSKGESIGNDLRSIVDDGIYYIGYKVTHRYRAKNNAGETFMDKEVFIIDKEVTKVVSQYNADTYEQIQMAIDIMLNN